MDCKAKKYLHIYDWNYWWGYYRCGKDWEPFHGAEFSLNRERWEREGRIAPTKEQDMEL